MLTNANKWAMASRNRIFCTTFALYRKKMRYEITAPKKFDATIKLPASKSISNRALVIHALSYGNIMPRHLSDCDDTEVMVNALRDMP